MKYLVLLALIALTLIVIWLLPRKEVKVDPTFQMPKTIQSIQDLPQDLPTKDLKG